MYGIIKKNECYLVFENNMRVVFYPSGRYTPCYHTPVAKLSYTVILLKIVVINVYSYWIFIFVSHAETEMVQ